MGPGGLLPIRSSKALSPAGCDGTIGLVGEDSGAIYQHPLAYLLGLEGVALLHAFGGEHGETFTLDRIRECRELLAMSERLGSGARAWPVPTRHGYQKWASRYDQPGNQLIDIEQ